MKPVKFSVAVVLRNLKGKVLAVQRPHDDENLPNVWGQPAVSQKGNELPEEMAKRVGSEKLCCQIKPISFVGIKSKDRGEYELMLMDIESTLVKGEPNVLNSLTTSTKYVDQKWTTDLSLFKDAAQKGSLCSQILLETNKIKY